MGMSPVPRRDLDALAWMRGFVLPISASPQVYGLSPSDGQLMLKLFLQFEQAMAANRRVQSCIELRQHKNVARRQAQQLLMLYYHQIKVNAGVSDAEKLAANINPVNLNRTKRFVPGTHPVLNVVAATNGAHTLTYKDSMSIQRAKPFGAVFLELSATIADDIDRDPANARHIGDYTRNPVVVAFENREDGKKATYFARWKGASGDVGPWSTPVSFRIAA
jgi:hypothetical protein